MKKGIDVSGWQGEIFWDKVKSQIEFAILKLGNVYENEELYIDSKFELNYKEATKNKIPIGVYVYSYITSEAKAKENANKIIEYMKNKKIQLPIYLDLEDKTIRNINKDKMTKIITVFCETLENAGYWAGIYCNLDWAKNVLDMNKLKRFTLWIAQYYSTCTYNGDYAIWQKQSDGKIEGIKGNVDIDIMYQDIIQKEVKEDKSKIIKSKFDEIKQKIQELENLIEGV